MTDSEKLDQILKRIVELENTVRLLHQIATGAHIGGQIGAPANPRIPYGMQLWWDQQNQGL